MFILTAHFHFWFIFKNDLSCISWLTEASTFSSNSGFKATVVNLALLSLHVHLKLRVYSSVKKLLNLVLLNSLRLKYKLVNMPILHIVRNSIQADVWFTQNSLPPYLLIVIQIYNVSYTFRKAFGSTLIIC